MLVGEAIFDKLESRKGGGSRPMHGGWRMIDASNGSVMRLILPTYAVIALTSGYTTRHQSCVSMRLESPVRSDHCQPAGTLPWSRERLLA